MRNTISNFLFFCTFIISSFFIVWMPGFYTIITR